jgi:outer membrane receptor protein involved in Fe transport
VILQPRWLPGLSITADYYDIKISSVISSVDAQTILDGCYDGADLNNAFCQLIFPRNAGGTFQLPALLQSSLNFAAEKAKGVDVDVNYDHRFDPDNRLQLRFVGNWVKMRTDYPYIDNPTQPERIKGELGDPIYSFNASVDYTYKNVTLGYEFRYIGRQSITDWEAQHDTSGVPALDPYYADRVYYPSVTYHNLRASIDVAKIFTFYGGVDNITDKKPPLGVLGTGSLGDADAIYDNIGRFFYMGVKASF